MYQMYPSIKRTNPLLHPFFRFYPMRPLLNFPLLFIYPNKSNPKKRRSHSKSWLNLLLKQRCWRQILIQILEGQGLSLWNHFNLFSSFKILGLKNKPKKQGYNHYNPARSITRPTLKEPATGSERAMALMPRSICRNRWPSTKAKVDSLQFRPDVKAGQGWLGLPKMCSETLKMCTKWHVGNFGHHSLYYEMPCNICLTLDFRSAFASWLLILSKWRSNTQLATRKICTRCEISCWNPIPNLAETPTGWVQQLQQLSIWRSQLPTEKPWSSCRKRRACELLDTSTLAKQLQTTWRCSTVAVLDTPTSPRCHGVPFPAGMFAVCHSPPREDWSDQITWGEAMEFEFGRLLSICQLKLGKAMNTFDLVQRHTQNHISHIVTQTIIHIHIL